jgi:hypothetical protein
VNKTVLLMSASFEILGRKRWCKPMRVAIAIVLLALFSGPSLFGQEKDAGPEAYKLRIDGQFWRATPTASISGSDTETPINIRQTQRGPTGGLEFNL